MNQFPDTSLEDITKVVARYRAIEAWPQTTTFKEASFNHLQKIMKAYGELDKDVPFQKLTYAVQ